MPLERGHCGIGIVTSSPGLAGVMASVQVSCAAMLSHVFCGCPCRSLGVTIWELFELGAQPYPQHSDRQVLAYAVREQQLKLPKPQLQLSLSDRW